MNPGISALLDDATIRATVGHGAFARGQDYHRQGRVSQLGVDPQGRLITADVQGARATPYRVVVTPSGPREWSGRCSCPMVFDCKHVAAVLIAAARGQQAELPVQREQPAGWERQVAALVGASAAQEPTGQPLALSFEPMTEPGRGGRLRMRPLTRSHTGRWVRSGCAWRDLQSPYGAPHLDRAQREALRAMLLAAQAGNRGYSYYGADTVHFDELGAAMWHLLEQATAAGVELIVGKEHLVAVGAPVLAVLDARLDPGTGDLWLTPEVSAAGTTVRSDSVSLLGDPPTGVYSLRAEGIDALAPVVPGVSGRPVLVLAPFAERPAPQVATLLRAGRSLDVPAHQVERFFATYFPRLRPVVTVTARDGSVRLPEVVPPRLALTVTFEPSTKVVLDWAFVYPSAAASAAQTGSASGGAGVGGGGVRVPLSGGAADEVLRDLQEEQRLLAALAPASRANLDTGELDGMAAVRFTTAVLPVLCSDDAVEVTVVGEVPEFREAAQAPVVSLGVQDTEDRDWFDLAVSVTVEGQTVPFDQLFRALALEQSHLVLPSGLYLPLDSDELATLRQLIEEARGLQERDSRGGIRVSVFQAGLWEELLELGVVESQSARWHQAVRGLLEVDRLESPEPPAGFQAILRPYQQEGYAWLAFLEQHGLGGILADDMGLGKTVQTLAMICAAKARGELEGPFLVVAPTSVVGNWAREAARFAPDLEVRAVTETTKRRKADLADDVAGADLVVTSYALLRIDEPAYVGLSWAGLVLDEAQYVKNHQAKTYQVARKLPAPFKLAVTGTPLENSLMDLWSLLSIVAPGLYPSPQRFSEDYRRPIERGAEPELLGRLRRRIRPLMLRRTKEQVVTELPPKQEQVLEVVLDPKHQKVYQTHLQRERKKVLGLLDDLDRNRFEILKSLTLLRQLSLAPVLVDDDYAAIPASKVEVFVETLREVVQEGHRALVFSQFTGFLKVVRERLDAEGIAYCYLDGRTRNRPERVAEFKEGSAPAFLISLKAGGVGLNLTEADYVFVLDPWWNPAVEAQAVDRTHRIGQDKTVMVYRMVAAGTIEEKVMELKARKQDLFDRVVDDGAMMAAPLSVDDIKGLFG